MPALWPPGPGPRQPSLSELSFYLLVGSWRAPLSHLAPLPTVKAVKKAGQEKMIQQEHERQVWGAARAWGPHGAQPGPTFTAVSAAGAGRRASCHGPQDPHEVRLTQPASVLSWVPHHQPTQSSDQALRVEENESLLQTFVSFLPRGSTSLQLSSSPSCSLPIPTHCSPGLLSGLSLLSCVEWHPQKHHPPAPPCPHGTRRPRHPSALSVSFTYSCWCPH